jgi:pSer/pThr/pTyr-binding forkhead associated (FHA) protein
VVESGSKKGAAVPLAQPEVTIGRSLECHLALPDSQVSAHHARIVQRKGGYYLYDERSLNGVFVNDAKVRGVALRSGDSIRLGETLLRFLDPAAPPMPPAEPAPGPIHPVGRYGARRWILVGGAALALLLAILYWIWR